MLTVLLLISSMIPLLDIFLSEPVFFSHRVLQRLFDASAEESLASWLSSVQTFLLSLTAWILFYVRKKSGARIRTLIAWSIVAVFFTYFALDDALMLHEIVGTGVILNHPSLDVFPSYTWILIFVPVFVFFALFLLFFLWDEIPYTGARIGVMLCLFLWVLAVLMDFVEGMPPDHRWNFYAWMVSRMDPNVIFFSMQHFNREPLGLVVHLSKVIEETIELISISLLWSTFIYALLRSCDDGITIKTDISLLNENK